MMFGRRHSYRGFIYFICFVCGGTMIWFSLQTILDRALIEVSGTILKSEEWHVPFHSHRLRTTYTIQPFDGEKTIQYIAGGNDPSLAPHLPVGTVVEKEKWEITYKVNDEIVKDFPLRHYIITGSIGFCFVIVAGLIYLAYRLYLRRSYGD